MGLAHSEIISKLEKQLDTTREALCEALQEKNRRPLFANEMLRYPRIHELTGASRTTLWRWERAGLWPRRVQLGPRGVGWLRREVEQHLQTRPRSRLKGMRK